jgi:hypothetical protein
MQSTQLAGCTFRATTVKPYGKVQVIAEPENKFDPNAVRVEFERELIGYLPKNSDAQKMFKFAPLVFEATAVDYCFSRGTDEADQREFNNEDQGHLASVKIEFSGENPDNYHEKDGKMYERITAFLKRNEDKYTSEDDRKRLEDWKKTADHETVLKFAAKGGTIAHKLIEEILTGEGAIHNLIEKEDLGTPTAIEERVYDEDLQLSGTYDAKFSDAVFDKRDVIVDWKTSSSVRKSHELQVSFYAKQAGASEAWVVCIGTKTKQGYSIRKLNEKQIEENYQFIKSLHNKYKPEFTYL